MPTLPELLKWNALAQRWPHIQPLSLDVYARKLCIRCGAPIDWERQLRAIEGGDDSTTCSNTCRQKARRLRKAARDAAATNVVDTKDSMTEPYTGYAADGISLDSLNGLEELRSKPSRTYSEKFVRKLKRVFCRERKSALADNPFFADAQRRFDVGEFTIDQAVNYFLTEWPPPNHGEATAANGH